MRNLLEIICDGEPIDMFPDTEISMEWNNMMFNPDEMPETYSLPFELPSTPKILRMLNNPQRLASSGLFTEIPATVRFSGVMLFQGNLCILEAGPRKIRVAIVGSDMPLVTKEPLNKIPLARYDLGAGNLTTAFSSAGDIGYQYADLISAHVNDTSGYPSKNFTAGPILRSNPFPMNTINWEDNWKSNRPQYLSYFLESFLQTGLRPNESWVKHYPIYPAVYVGHILNAIFGETLANNVFASGELARLVVPSEYHPKTPVRGILLDTSDTPESSNHYFRLNSFMPDYPANDFVKHLLCAFCMGLYPSGKNSLSMVNYGDIISGISVSDWSVKMIDFTSKPEEARTYVGGYRDEKRNSEEVTSDVASPDNLESYPIANNNSGVLKVTTLGEIFKATMASYRSSFYFNDTLYSYETWKREYEILDDGLDNVEASADKTLRMISDLRPMSLMVDPYMTGVLYAVNPREMQWTIRRRVVPLSDEQTSASYTPSLLFYRGLRRDLGDSTVQYPYLTPFHYDGRGNRVGDMSLSWAGSDGLLQKHHAVLKQWVERPHRRLSGRFLLTAKDVASLNLTHQVHVQGKNFVIDKLKVTLRTSRIDPATVEMVDV